jgi:hypothetical protein
MVQGLGIRATARVFEVDPHTVLHWLAEAAEQLRAFSAYFLCDLHLEQLQRDESDTPGKAGGLMSGAASKAVSPLTDLVANVSRPGGWT